MPSLFVPLDGRITSQNVLTSPDGTTAFMCVYPGNETEGNSYQITLATIATYVLANSFTREVITTGATIGDPYVVDVLNDAVLVNKAVGAATYITCPLAATFTSEQQILFKDTKGDADTNPITITFTGGELCDGLSSVTISNPYGWVRLAAFPGGGKWYMC